MVDGIPPVAGRPGRPRRRPESVLGDKAYDSRAVRRELRRCTEKGGKVVDSYLHLAAVLVTLRMLIRRATKRYRWDRRPTTRRLK